MEQTPTIVNENAGSRNFLWGFLTVVFGLALVRGHLGAETDSGRLAVDLFAALFGLSLLGWVWFNRHPARLEITPEAIVHLHRGRSEGIRLTNTGHLFISRTMIGGKHPVAYLRVAGSEDAIPMGSFSSDKIRQASIAAGWRWGELPT